MNHQEKITERLTKATNDYVMACITLKSEIEWLVELCPDSVDSGIVVAQYTVDVVRAYRELLDASIDFSWQATDLRQDGI